MPAVTDEVKIQAGTDSTPEADPRRNQRSEPGFGCVYISASFREAELVSSMVESERIRIFHADTLEDAAGQLKITHSRVLLTNTQFRNGNWKQALELCFHIKPPVSMIVASRSADDKLWLNVLERGAYDLVRKPFQADELCRILQNAHTQALSGGLRRMTA